MRSSDEEMKCCVFTSMSMTDTYSSCLCHGYHTYSIVTSAARQLPAHRLFTLETTIILERGKSTVYRPTTVHEKPTANMSPCKMPSHADVDFVTSSRPLPRRGRVQMEIRGHDLDTRCLGTPRCFLVFTGCPGLLHRPFGYIWRDAPRGGFHASGGEPPVTMDSGPPVE